MKKFFKKTEGFTLVELIVVIAILGILAGVGTVGYSGYIKKAQTAADEQLLASLNTAFASACIENGKDVHTLTSAAATLEAVEGGMALKSISPYQTTFEKYYSGGTFKVTKALYFDTASYRFKALSTAYTSLLGTFDNKDITAFNNSIFKKIGFTPLMNQVDMATQIALAASDGSTLNQMVFDSANEDALAEYMGYDSFEDEEFAVVYQGMMEKKMEQLVANGADEDDYAALAAQAHKEIMANTAVLVAATKSDFDTAAFASQLAAGNGKSTIKSSMNGDDGNQIALSQTAMAYAMYTSYTTKNGGTPTSNIMEVLDVLESDGFKNYMANESTNDLNGYLAAMNMIGDVSGNTDAVSALLVNGFTDPELVGALTQEIGG